MNISSLHQLFLDSTGITTDTRKIESGNLFFALKGENFNGNLFANNAIEKGALASIVDEDVDSRNPKIIRVDDVLQTLQELANFHRKYLGIPIVSLTGSNGKTTTKELIATILSEKYKTLATVGNLNNHIGVPLTLLSIKTEEMAVVEMGANHLKEIEQLCSIAEPDFGYITNFGKAHLEGFGGEEGVIQGKSEMYSYLKQNNKLAFVNADDPKQMEKSASLNRITFSFKNNGDYHFTSFKNQGFAGIKYNGTSIQSHLVGNYNTINLAAAATIGLYFDVSIGQIKTAIENYIPQNNRSQIIQKNNKTILLDAYNANPSSMQLALENFAEIPGEKAVILGDMFELGQSSLEEHQHIADLCAQLSFEQVFLIGRWFSQVKTSSDNIILFQERDDFSHYLKIHAIQANNILIKGSRGMALEKLLDEMV